MRHKYKGRKLGTSFAHTKAMKVSLVQALFLNDRIKTTEARAKEIRGDVDKVITWAKKGDLHSRRLAIAALGNDSDLVREIFEKVNQGMFEGRSGGYTRIMKLGPRKGDGAPMVIMELVNETCVPKAEKKAAKAKATPAKKKAAPKKKAADAEAGEKETVLEEMHDSIEAAEETFAENVREEGEKQLAEEKAEAAKEDAAAADEAEEKAEDEAKADEKVADEQKEEAKEEAEEAEAEAAEEAAVDTAEKVEKSEE